jgi:hypothetical protein
MITDRNEETKKAEPIDPGFHSMVKTMSIKRLAVTLPEI